MDKVEISAYSKSKGTTGDCTDIFFLAFDLQREIGPTLPESLGLPIVSYNIAEKVYSRCDNHKMIDGFLGEYIDMVIEFLNVNAEWAYKKVAEKQGEEAASTNKRTTFCIISTLEDYSLLKTVSSPR